MLLLDNKGYNQRAMLKNQQAKLWNKLKTQWPILIDKDWRKTVAYRNKFNRSLVKLLMLTTFPNFCLLAKMVIPPKYKEITIIWTSLLKIYC